MSKKHKRRAPKKENSGQGSTSVQQVQRRLRHTERTHLAISQLPCSEPTEKPEEAALESTSTGPFTRLRAATTDGHPPSVKIKKSWEYPVRDPKKSRTESSDAVGHLPSVKRKSSWDSPVDTERDRRKSRTESSDVEPGHYGKTRPDVHTKRKILKKKLSKSTIAHSIYGSSSCSSAQDETVQSLGKATILSESSAGPSQVLETAQAQLQIVTIERSPSQNQCDYVDSTEFFIDKETLEQVHESENIAFQQKYAITTTLRVGGYAVGYNGFRKADKLPVAIKRIEAYHCPRSRVMINGMLIVVPLEVANLIRVGAGPGEEPCSVTPLLLDWYDLGIEIIIVMEKPEPCMDLVDYINRFMESITEHDAKVIFRQMVDAAITMLALGVFHRDIKPDNVLIEMGQPVPRARFIDFGCATICSPFENFQTPPETDIYFPPEFFLQGRYRSESTTVWQLGLTLYSILNCRRPFACVESICSSYQPPMRSALSDDCKEFLKRLMDKDPETRISLNEAKSHPWMN